MHLTGTYANAIPFISQPYRTLRKKHHVTQSTPRPNAIMPKLPQKKGGGTPFSHDLYMALYFTDEDAKIHGNVGTKIDIAGPPDRHESYLLAEGEKKVTLEPETRKSNPAL